MSGRVTTEQALVMCWKHWHREVVSALGLSVVERGVTLQAVKEARAEIARLRVVKEAAKEIVAYRKCDEPECAGQCLQHRIDALDAALQATERPMTAREVGR